MVKFKFLSCRDQQSVFLPGVAKADLYALESSAGYPLGQLASDVIISGTGPFER